MLAILSSHALASLAMDLHTYIDDMGRRRDLAAATKTSPDYLWQIATGRRRASTGLAQAIERYTTASGPETISKSSLRPDVWPPDSSRRHRTKAAAGETAKAAQAVLTPSKTKKAA